MTEDPASPTRAKTVVLHTAVGEHADGVDLERGDSSDSSRKEEAMQRIAVIAKLRAGAAEEAARLIDARPPFDPAAHQIERHTVFLAPDVAVFIFEGGHVASLLASLGSADEQSVLAAWEPLLDGTPIFAREAYHWIARED
jgi:hypothetical protein